MRRVSLVVEREESAEGDVIRAGIGRLDRGVAAVVAGDADDPLRPEDLPRLLVGGVLLPDMNAVASGLERQVGPVVHDEGDAALLRDRA